MQVEEFISKPYTKELALGSVQWSSPSNIALVKYWGKKEHQIPTNPSISFTLDTCRTTTTLKFKKRDFSTSLETTEVFSFEVYLDGQKKDDFKPKIATFFKRIETYVPFLKDYHFVIETSNSFPHSSGIASSASGMSALALCLMSIEKQLLEDDETMSASEGSQFMQKASFLARLGSGSACRSLEGDLIVWGEHKDVEGSSNLFGTKYPYKVHENFKNFQDTILLVDKGEKQVSSTVGHGLMHKHAYAEQRFKQANDNLFELIEVLKKGDLDKFIAIVESEALSLHAMMMTSRPYFILMKPNTLSIINKIWEFRKESGLHLCFTLDAGANVHLLYPENEADQVIPFIKETLSKYCHKGEYINDRTGFGAVQIK